MESQEIILSKLVLGYLKSEKCKSAYKEFLKSSPNLQPIDINTKYIATRFLGRLTLADIFTEYLDIFQIIQGRLEATNYYNEDHPKVSLVNQLLYLLNRVPSSCPSSPVSSTPHGSHTGDRSPSHVDHSDLEATPVETLPGNIPNETSYSPRRKGGNRYGKSIPATSTPNEKEANRSELFNTELLAENLLENKEFHEKIAQTINKVVERQFDTTVKEVIQETEQDPMFDQILEEIIGTTANMGEIYKETDCTSAINSITNIAKENKNKYNKRNESEEVPESHSSGNEHNDNIKPSSSSCNTAVENLQSIAGRYVPQKTTLEGNMENCVTSTQCSIVTTNPCIQNPLYINTVTSLLIPSIAALDTTKSYLVVNNPSQLPAVPTTLLSEQDIMKMPIIIKDDGTTPTTKVDIREKDIQPRVKTLLPKQNKQKIKVELAPEAPVELKDYFKNYKPENETAKKPGLKHVMFPKRKAHSPVKKPKSSSEKKSNSNIDPVPISQTENEEVIVSSTESKIRTPMPSEPIKKSTPKSGSHVRNLDFSTPVKTKHKPKDQRGRNIMEDQKQGAKTLLNFGDKGKVWDADLRSAVVNDVKISPKKSIKKTSKKKKAKLNTTEQEGLLLEAAIKTPVKSMGDEKDTCQNSQGVIETHSTVINAEKISDDDKLSSPLVKTILSPSKLNASKHNILATQPTDGKSASYLTPDMTKENVSLPITANRNIASLLETPLKEVPKTPGILTPLGFKDDGTPFSDMIKANLNGMDISSIQTPCELITPGSFPPHTPNIDLISPYTNRPTDYSTGSSYYQPSDNEINKNLEAHIREVEKTTGSTISPESITVADRLQIFNKNVIGTKNLSLIKKDIVDLEKSSDDSSEEEQDQDSSIDWGEKEDTIIFKRKTETPRRTYSLRTRKKKVSDPKQEKVLNAIKNLRRENIAKKEKKRRMSKHKSSPDLSKSDNQENTEELISPFIKNKVIGPESSSIPSLKEETKQDTTSLTTVKGVSTSKFSVLEELERKRLRTIDSIKTNSETITKPKKQVNGKFKIKPIAKVYTTKTGKKADSPRKRKRAKDLKTLMNDLITSDDSDINFCITDDEDVIEEKKMEEDENTKLKTVLTIAIPDKSASDMEAQNLIDGLKERGIHLMHKKSPLKKSLGVTETSQIINTSDVNLSTIDRDRFDINSKEQEDIKIVFDETQTVDKSRRPRNLKDNKQIYVGKLFLESIMDTIDVPLKLTEFFTLIDIPPSTQASDHKNLKAIDSENQSKKQKDKNGQKDEKGITPNEEKPHLSAEPPDDVRTKRIVSRESRTSFYSCQSSNDAPVDDDLMNFAVSGKEESASPKRSKKRRLSDESESENSRTKILKTLDVDSFLNTIHCRPKQ